MKWMFAGLVLLLVWREKAAAEPAPEPIKETPGSYAPAFYSGAQAEFVGPTAGVSSLALGYDSGSLQVDLSLGFGAGEEPIPETSSGDVYAAGLRCAIPIHQGIRADYALLAATGALLLHPPTGGADAVGLVGIGARFRAFFSPNVAVVGALGFVVIFDGDDAAFFLGARPLGSAAVHYYFR